MSDDLNVDISSVDELSVDIRSQDEIGVVNIGAVDINHIYYPSNEGVEVVVDFSYGDVSPKSLTTISSGKMLFEISFAITTAFNGVGAKLSVGDADDHKRFVPESYVDAAQTFVFSVHPWYRYSVDTEVNLYITPGTDPTAGAGTIRLISES